MMKTVHKLRFTYLSVICRMNIWQDDLGQDLIEYALISALIAVAAISGMKHVASAVLLVFSNVSSLLA